MSKKKWYEIDNIGDIISPSILVYPERIEKNIQLLLEMVGGPEKLRPHIKTHKIAEIIQMQIRHGIHKFKCATIAEAELLARCKAKDILLAMQPVGINVQRYFELIRTYPHSKFSTIVDNLATLNNIAAAANDLDVIADLWVDINNGMNRTGISPEKGAVSLYQVIVQNLSTNARGLHVYDGHILDTDLNIRKKTCDKDFKSVLLLKNKIESLGMKIETIVAGGTPTFPIHLLRDNVEISPGTFVFWDEKYSINYPDLNFLQAAVIVSRIVSRPLVGHICLDLGHKSVASEMNLPRVKILGHEHFEHVSQSEEHLVLHCQKNNRIIDDELLYAVPIHICPTVSKYKEVYTVKDHKANGSWQVTARDHKLSI